MDTSVPHSLHDTEGSYYTSSYPCYPDPKRRYVVYTDASDDTCGAQLSQEYGGAEIPIAFISHTFT